jgi:hypothetical protein
MILLLCFFSALLIWSPGRVEGLELRMGTSEEGLKRRFKVAHDTTVCSIESSFPLPPLSTSLLGLLKVGIPKTWDDSKKDLKYIREAGVRQFISTYNRVKDLKGDDLLWGDEIEYGVFHLDPDKKKVRLSLRAKEVR